VRSADVLKEGFHLVANRVDKKRKASSDGDNLDGGCGEHRGGFEFFEQPFRGF
jgi:hypothetical protein